LIPVAGDAVNAWMSYVLVVEKAQQAEYVRIVEFAAQKSNDMQDTRVAVSPHADE
jgi:hypothetical protein